jgi:hypothetical protein
LVHGMTLRGKVMPQLSAVRVAGCFKSTWDGITHDGAGGGHAPVVGRPRRRLLQINLGRDHTASVSVLLHARNRRIPS